MKPAPSQVDGTDRGIFASLREPNTGWRPNAVARRLPKCFCSGPSITRNRGNLSIGQGGETRWHPTDSRLLQLDGHCNLRVHFLAQPTLVVGGFRLGRVGRARSPGGRKVRKRRDEATPWALTTCQPRSLGQGSRWVQAPLPESPVSVLPAAAEGGAARPPLSSLPSAGGNVAAMNLRKRRA